MYFATDKLPFLKSNCIDKVKTSHYDLHTVDKYQWNPIKDQNWQISTRCDLNNKGTNLVTLTLIMRSMRVYYSHNHRFNLETIVLRSLFGPFLRRLRLCIIGLLFPFILITVGVDGGVTTNACWTLSSCLK